MREESEFKIRAEERQGWGAIALVWTGSVMSVPALMLGGVIGNGLAPGIAVLGILVGYFIVCTYMSLVGIQGCDTGLPTAVMASGALGEKGAKYIISTILAIACIGWFGIQAGVCGTSFSMMFGEFTGIQIPVWTSSVIWGVIMLTTASFRFNGIKKLNRFAVPLLLIVCLYTLVKELQNGGFAALQTHQVTEPVRFVEVVGLTVGHFAVAGAISGDYCRFARSRKDVVKSSFLGVIPAGTAVLMLGAVLLITTGESNISVVLASSGLPVLALIALILTTWTTNVANAYSGGLSLAILLNQDEEKSRATTAIAGILGTILAAMGILNELKTFLSLLTALVPPLVGPMIADYWILHKGKVADFAVRPGIHGAGLAAYAAGALTACITGGIFARISFLKCLDYPFFIGPVNGIVVAIIVYLILQRRK